MNIKKILLLSTILSSVVCMSNMAMDTAEHTSSTMKACLMRYKERAAEKRYDDYIKSFKRQNEDVEKSLPIMFDGVPSIRDDERRNIVFGEPYSIRNTANKRVTIGRDSILRINNYGETQLVSEEELRDDPKTFFRQDKITGMCYVKLGRKLYPAGIFYMNSLKDKEEREEDFSRHSRKRFKKCEEFSEKTGKMFVAFAGKGAPGEKLLDIQSILDTNKFDLASPIVSQNCIETDRLDASKIKYLREYCDNPSQGTAFMIKCPWTALCLLHMPGLNGKVYNRFNDSYEERSGDKINLLYKYGINTSAGHITSSEFHDFDRDDERFQFMTVEEAPVSLNFGSVFNDRGYFHNESGQVVRMFLDSALPGGEPSSVSCSEEVCKAHLKRHYMALFNYCKEHKVKRAIVPLIGLGSFGNKMQWHKEVLDDPEIRDLMMKSGTVYVFNAHTDVDAYDVFGKEAVDFSGCNSMDAFDRLK